MHLVQHIWLPTVACGRTLKCIVQSFKATFILLKAHTSTSHLQMIILIILTLHFNWSRYTELTAVGCCQSIGQSRLWVEPLVHRPKTYLQAPCVAAKASFCSRTLSRDPLTAFRSDIVLLSSARILSCSTLKQIWPCTDLPASKYAKGIREVVALVVIIRRPVCMVQQESSAGRFPTESWDPGEFNDQTFYSQSWKM